MKKVDRGQTAKVNARELAAARSLVRQYAGKPKPTDRNTMLFLERAEALVKMADAREAQSKGVKRRN